MYVLNLLCLRNLPKPSLFVSVVAAMASVPEMIDDDISVNANPLMVTEAWLESHCVLEQQLGAGSFSNVHLCSHKGEWRAFKIIKRNDFLKFQTRSKTRLTLRDELNVMTILKHVNVLMLCEWFETVSSIYLVLAWQQGGDLLQSLLTDKFFEESQARNCFTEIIQAVAYMHTKAIVHRDLKAENILLTTSNRAIMHPKIADFGLALQIKRHGVCRTVCGTPLYMAPEILMLANNRDINELQVGYATEVDMWSLGVLLYILLSAQPPFYENENLEEQILQAKYEFDGLVWTRISSTATDLINCLMRVNPAARLRAEQAFEHPWILSSA